jgi:hypothetical protein
MSAGLALISLLILGAFVLRSVPALLVVMPLGGVAWALVAEMPTRGAPLPITPTANFTQGDLVMLADCAGASMLQVTNAGAGAAGSIQHVSGAAGVVPGVVPAEEDATREFGRLQTAVIEVL